MKQTITELTGTVLPARVQSELFNNEWGIVTYLNLQQASDNVDVIGKYLGAT
jgi:hypothetical protein